MKHPNDVGAAIDLADYWKQVAASRLGVAASQLIGFFHPIGSVGEYDSADFTGGTGGTRTYTGGYYRLDTASGTGTARYTPGSTGAAEPVPVIAGAATKFWLGFRGKMNNVACGANCIVGVTLRDVSAANQFCFGKRGAQSAANWVVFGGTGTPFNTGLAFDAAVHNFEVYRADGATTVPVIDGVPRTTGDARPTNDSGIDLTATDNAGAQQQFDLAWYSLWVVSP